MGWGGRQERGSGWGTRVNPWLIHVNVWQKPLQYCKVISLQLILKKDLFYTLLPCILSFSSWSLQHLLDLYHFYPLLGGMLPWYFYFPEEISSLSPFIVSSIIKHCSLKKTFLSLLAILWNSVFNWIYLSLSPLLSTSLHSSTICKVSSDNHFAFLLFFFVGMVLFAAYCITLWTSVHLQVHC